MRNKLIDILNTPPTTGYVIVTATGEQELPTIDDWGDLVDNIPAVQIMIKRIWEYALSEWEETE